MRRPWYIVQNVSFPSALAVSLALACLAGAQIASAQEDDLSDDLTPYAEGSERKQPLKSTPESKNEEGSQGEKNTNGDKDKKKKAPERPRPQYVDTSVEEKPAPSQEAKPEVSDEFKEREARLSEPLKKLVQAGHLYDLSKGGGSECSKAFADAAKAGASQEPDLLWIVENGSPAGKIYAASLIRLFNPGKGTKLLDGFKPDKTLVESQSLTSQEHYTIGELATDLLAPKPTIILRRP